MGIEMHLIHLALYETFSGTSVRLLKSTFFVFSYLSSLKINYWTVPCTHCPIFQLFIFCKHWYQRQCLRILCNSIVGDG